MIANKNQNNQKNKIQSAIKNLPKENYVKDTRQTNQVTYKET